MCVRENENKKRNFPTFTFCWLIFCCCCYCCFCFCTQLIKTLLGLVMVVALVSSCLNECGPYDDVGWVWVNENCKWTEKKQQQQFATLKHFSQLTKLMWWVGVWVFFRYFVVNGLGLVGVVKFFCMSVQNYVKLSGSFGSWEFPNYLISLIMLFSFPNKYKLVKSLSVCF